LTARWSRVELGDARDLSCPGAATTPAPLVTGDFNGDGTEDVALWISAAGTPRLAALFARLDGEYTAVEAGDPALVGSSMLEVARRGTTYRLESLRSGAYFGLDTVALRGCDGARTALFWTGESFDAQRLID
jgi:hypothetical protein